MKQYLFFAIIIVLFVSGGSLEANSKVSSECTKKGDNPDVNIYFFDNQGEYPQAVAYYAKAAFGNMFVTKEGKLAYNLAKRTNDKTQSFAFFENFIGANEPEIEGRNGSTGKYHRFKGNDFKQTQKTNYPSVLLEDLYDGIDLELKMHSQNIEKIFAVQPKANPHQIKIKTDGTNKLNVVDDALILDTDLGKLSFTNPVAFQIIDGVKHEIPVEYTILSDNTYGFKTGDYDDTHTLYIDPLLASTFIGGTSNDYGRNMGFDQNGKLFITGYTWSGDYPTTAGVYDQTYNGGDYDVFVSRFDSTLTTLEASTFIGGSLFDMGMNLSIEPSSGDVIVTGYVDSNDFPTTAGAYSGTFSGGDSDIFICRLSNDLSSLLASTYLGGSDEEESSSIIIDEATNEIYITGYTLSADYPTTPGAHDEILDGSGEAVFVSQLDYDLTSLTNSTFIEGGNSDKAESMIFDQNDDIVLTGHTNSYDFPTSAGAYDLTHNSSNDVFLTRISNDLSSIMHSTFVGGSSYERGNDLLIDPDDNIFVTGYTASTDFPTTTGAFNESFNDSNDSYVFKMSGDLSTLINSTFIGGSYWDYAYGIVFDEDDNIFIAGNTYSADFPTTTGAYDTVHSVPDASSTDVFISKLDTSLTNVLSSTFIGGTSFDYLEDIILDMYNQVFVTGYTASGDYPTTPGVYQESYNGTPVSSREVFISKFDKNLSTQPPVIITHPTDTTACENSEAIFYVEAVGGGNITYQWYQGTGGIYNPIPGAENDTLFLVVDLSMDGDSIFCEVSNEGGTVFSDTAQLNVDELITADAGPDQALCETDNTVMGAIPPSSGTGTWALVSGSGNISNVNDPASPVNNLGMGENLFEWEVINGTCISRDTVSIVQDSVITANAGADFAICDIDTCYLNANAATPGTGMWTANDGGNIAAPTDENTLVTDLPYGDNSFTWEITNGACTDSDDVTVTRDSIVIADAGPDQAFCEVDTTTLNAVDPAPVSGMWSVVAGNAVFDNPSDPNSFVSDLDAGQNILEWTVTNGACTDSDQVIIQQDSIIPADAGPDIAICDAYHTVITAGDPDPGTGLWIVESGSGIVAQENQHTTTVTGLSIDDNELIWEVTNGTCVDTDTLNVHVDTTIQAQAMSDQDICGDSISLNALNPDPGSGMWSINAGSGIINQPDTNHTWVTGLAPGVNTLHWTVTNGACQTYDEIEIITDTIVTANAGNDTTICDISTLALSAEDPTPGTGTWSIISGSGNITDTHDPNTTITNLPEGTTELQWTVINGTCSDSDNITITRDIMIDAQVADDYAVCEENITIEGNDPAPGTSQWQVIGGNSTLVSPGNHITDVNNLDEGENIFLYTITNGACTSEDTLYVTRDTILPADAGDDIALCQQDTLSLPGDDNGEWSLISGDANVDNTMSPGGPIALVTDIGLGEHTLEFTMTNGACNDSDRMTITRDSLVIANAGSDQEICDDDNTLLFGNEAPFAEGLWSTSTGDAEIDNPEQPITSVSNISPGENVFTWTVVNGACMDSDSVVVHQYESVYIVKQPQTRTVIQADTIMFIVEAEGDTTGYQWLKDGEEITDTLHYSGINNDTLIINRISHTDEGTYTCLISGICGDVYSNSAELFVDGGVSIYPNPTSGKLHIEISRLEESYTFRLTDASGRIVLTDESSHNRILLDMTPYRSGLYILSIDFDNETINYKVIKE
ncbi:MAG: SBBP repeat-containing protein [Bacteroidales bacterium]